MNERILIVEDDAILSRVLTDNLTSQGYLVKSVANGATAVDVAKRFVPELVLLDVMLPGKDGFALCSELSHKAPSPIIIVSARGRKEDKLKGLALGADDFVTKPFDLEELLARVRAVLRRTKGGFDCVLGQVQIDFAGLRAWGPSGEIELTYKEFKLLEYLAARPDRVVHRDELLGQVWGYPDTVMTRAVDHAISRLRKKIEVDPHHPRFIHTVQGDGYRLTLKGAK